MGVRLLYLARHGEQDGGSADGALSARGRRQATLLGERLRGVPLHAVHHGPLRRAGETAALVAGSLPGVPVYATELAGDHLPHDTDPTGLPGAYAELLAGFAARERIDGPRRTAEAVARFAVASAEAPADVVVRELVITHNFLIAWLIRHALEAPVHRWLGLNLQHCALTVIRYAAAGPPNLITVNDVAHLPADLRGTGLPPEYRV
ncbi:histidine phosphatase family protein [Micromonospora matsumotoense]|uniref:histidine phosphatase family protein n=1 Tax=Micromonospora matsumotoense TaxID=121616 RepID=UPI003436CEF1